MAPFLASWGDAPAEYHASGEAYHLAPADGTADLYLGATPPDYTTDPQPSPTASGNTTDDGVQLSGVNLVQGQDATIHITATNNTGQTAYLNAWIDFDGDGQWSDDVTEKIAGATNSIETWNYFPVDAGVSSFDLTFHVPGGPRSGRPSPASV